MQTELYFKNPPIKYMKTITRLVLIVSLCGCFFVTEAQAAPINGKLVNTLKTATTTAKIIKIPPPSAPHPVGRPNTTWVPPVSTTTADYRRREQQRKDR